MWGLARLLLGISALLMVLIAAVGYLVLSQELPERPALSGKIVPGTLESGGLTRQWRTYVPARLSTRPPLIIVLHGSMGSSGTARVEDFGYDFDRIADQVGAVVVYPHGFDGYWNNATVAGSYTAKLEKVDDVAFLHALVDRMVAEYNVDRSAILVTGVSNGGGMVTRLALQTPSFARAYAVVAMNLPTKENTAVAAVGMPVSILFLNGTDDPIVPWDGGKVSFWPFVSNRGDVRSVQETVAYFRELAGAQSAPVLEVFSDRDPSDGCTVSRYTWIGSEGHRIVNLVVQGGGHGAPHPGKRSRRLLGKGNRDMHAAEAIWEFFTSTDPTSD